MSKKTYGFYGLGTMGTSIAEHLHVHSMGLQQGPALVASRTAAKARALADAKGLEYRPDFAALAAECDVLALCLSTSKDVASVIRSAPAFKAGALVVDVTSGDPGLTRIIGEELAARGVRLVDAPVSGGPKGAASGTLVSMLGGAENDMDEAWDVIGAWSSKVVRCGPLGSGDAVKAVNNALNSAHLLLATEGAIALKKYGVDPSVALDVVNSSSGMSLQSQRLPQYVLSRKFDFGFQLALMRKDVGIASDLVDSLTPTATLIPEVRRLVEAAEAKYGGDVDYTQVAMLLEDRADCELG
ncbi:hypothetical protein CTAYLR_002065 [Chrysophaeum taylorii]|uniref:3-hydroxyisobutyrate dehydrogenase n=1 Tax=Chrysophaeum taylorii TaxID=2483200 RepID=A0AAD7UMJ3_9STRA|nr:hypothetical protein CTAYLR_002065 [Chrysophaeum taylorii]